MASSSPNDDKTEIILPCAAGGREDMVSLFFEKALVVQKTDRSGINRGGWTSPLAIRRTVGDVIDLREPLTKNNLLQGCVRTGKNAMVIDQPLDDEEIGRLQQFMSDVFDEVAKDLGLMGDKAKTSGQMRFGFKL